MVIDSDFKPVRGSHCESSAMINALNCLGYRITEDELIGIGAAPAFIYEKSAFPFLGGRSLQMKECFSRISGIPYSIVEKPGEPRWDDIEELLKDNTPVIVRVDMRYLPYRYNGKIGPGYMSFGYHYVTLFDLDRESKSVLISDTEYSDLQAISISTLEKARFSKTKVYPPHGEFYYFSRPESHHDLNWRDITELSLKQFYRNMQDGSVQKKRLSGLAGLAQLGDEISRIHKSVPPILVGSILSFHYGCIETNGTGGAAFRTMYNRFLDRHLTGQNRDKLMPPACQCEKSWHALGGTYQTGALRYKKSSGDGKKEILKSIAESIQGVYTAEFEMNKAIKETYNLY